MRIHDLVIDNVRAIRHLELRDLPDSGVILIHGDNEAGKSTILDAIDAVLNVRHTSGGGQIRVLEPVGRDEGPEVSLTATVGPYTFTIHKRFKRRKLAELHITAPARQQFTGREADDKLEAILSEHLDADLAAVLFLRQGAADPGIAAAGIPSVTRALDEGGGAGGSLAGTEDTELMARIAAEYAEHFTAQGKKKAGYAALESAVDEARAVLRDRRADVERLADAVDEVERRNTEISDIDAELPEATEEHSLRAAEAEAARGVQAKADAAREKRERAEVDLRRAEEDLAARRAARERVDELRAESAALGEQLAPAVERAREEGETVARLTAERDTARGAVQAAREEVRRARAAGERARRARRLAELGDLVSRLDAADAELDRLLGAQPARPVTDADVRAIEEASSEVAVQRRLLDATAAKLDITSDTPAEITVDDTRVDVGEAISVALSEGTTIGLGGFTAVYRAGAAGSGSGAALEEAERVLADTLAAAGCDDLGTARSRRDEHSRLAADTAAARAQRDELTSGVDGREIRAELARLRDEASDDVSGVTVTPEEADALVERAEHDLDEATDAADRAEAALKPWGEKKAASELTVLEAKKEFKDAEVSAAEAELDSAEAAVPGAELEAAREAAATGLARAVEEDEALAAEVATLNPALAEDLLAGAAARLDNLRERRAQAEKRVIGLSSQIEVATGAAEQADRAEAALEAAELELQRRTRRAEAAKLLWETMCAHRDAARARYAEPFARALNRYAAVVFGPDVEFTLGENLEVQARTVADTTISLDQLSGGAREQMGILTRFAIAELAGKTSEGRVPVPVMVDDALGATDPSRLALMNSLFTTVGRDAQVFVLTCFPRRFDRVAAARTISMGEVK